MKTQFYTLAPPVSLRIDPEAGVIRDVAIMSIGEAKGHDCSVDLATLQALFRLTQGVGVKAFMNHSCNPAPTEAVGIFSGFYIDAVTGVLRAACFQALNAFKDHDRKSYDTLFELASTAPETFGVSVSIQHDNECIDGVDFVRPTSIDSADFVCAPAANSALFSVPVEISESALDVSENPIQVITDPIREHINPNTNTSHFMLKKLVTRFSANPTGLARAIQLAAAAPDTATAETIIDEVDEEQSAADAKAVLEENIMLKSKVADLEKQIADLAPSAAKADASAKEADALKLEIAGHVARLRRFGVAALKVTIPASSLPVITRAEFDALPHDERAAHFSKGGKLSD